MAAERRDNLFSAGIKSGRADSLGTGHGQFLHMDRTPLAASALLYRETVFLQALVLNMFRINSQQSEKDHHAQTPLGADLKPRPPFNARSTGAAIARTIISDCGAQ
jgi:hypothetical protein